ncbi:25747_t:CDS:2 [Gigaspora margarita]|uniref:25747_t:CDS:1 n=1 Tax=Gigaspora margarita TaxID=4874 RepID=A0ABN7VLA8_GIGMA|nr:25747_t:CDS:2 [Gigaspora margarita]
MEFENVSIMCKSSLELCRQDRIIAQDLTYFIDQIVQLERNKRITRRETGLVDTVAFDNHLHFMILKRLAQKIISGQQLYLILMTTIRHQQIRCPQSPPSHYLETDTSNQNSANSKADYQNPLQLSTNRE